MPQPTAPAPAPADQRPQVLSPAQLAAELGLPLKTIYGFNAAGTGPALMRMGKHVRFRRIDVDAWMAQRAGAA